VLPDGVVLRDATADDLSALIDALHRAVNWQGVERLTIADIMADPRLRGYVTGWPRPGDFGVVATSGSTAIGAAWCRNFSAQAPGYGYVADDVPEVSIGVAVDWRGRGVGTSLFAEPIARARGRGLRRISLSVEDGNRARRLYERAGFTVVGREGGSDVMLLNL
jgi:ribosomal protein S18 acetylase RimI-like enzyme